MNFISLQLRASTSATEVGIFGSATSASPDPTEALPEQCLDCLDPGTVKGNGDLLPEALPRNRGTCRLPTTPGSY